MNLSAARLSLAITFVIVTLVSVLVPPPAAVASHLPPPSEFVVRPADLPPGLEAVDASGVAALLPDNLARQASSLYRRDPSMASEPGVREVKQIVLAFDDRDATDYVPRFRDLMVKHQGFVVLGGDESAFRLTRTRGDETSIVVGQALAEVLVMTTVAGLAGTVGPEDAARLTGVAIARVPSIERSAAALSTEPGAASQRVGDPLTTPNLRAADRWPDMTATPPGPPSLAIVQARDERPHGDRALDTLIPLHQNTVISAAPPTDLAAYTQSVGTILDGFWGRTLQNTLLRYVPPFLSIAPNGEARETGCWLVPGETVMTSGLTYCDNDRTIYMDEPLLRQVIAAGADRPARDYVVATLLARGWAYHVQHLIAGADLNIERTEDGPKRLPLSDLQRVLQADCFAGMFARHERDQGMLTLGDLDVTRNALPLVRDKLVASVGGRDIAEQRKEWFSRGYVHFAFRDCEPW